MDMHGYPCKDIHAWISMHAIPLLEYPCTDIYARISMHGYPCMDLPV